MKEYKFKINGKDYAVTIGQAEGKLLNVNVNGADYQVELEKEQAPVAAPAPSPAPTAAPAAKPVSAGAGEKIKSPLPGVIIEVCVKEGQAVKAGQKTAVLEAMKMENEIPSPKDGTITAIYVNKGDSLLEGAEIASIA